MRFVTQLMSHNLCPQVIFSYEVNGGAHRHDGKPPHLRAPAPVWTEPPGLEAAVIPLSAGQKIEA